MATKTEPLHAGGFIASEANVTRSRETATVLSGQKLAAGEVVQKDGAGKLIAADGLLDTASDVQTEVAGVLFAAVDASATGANADVPGAVYIARDAEVVDADLTYPTESTAGGEKVATVASLAKLGIIART